MDLILPAIDLLGRLNLSETPKPKDHAIINSLSEFQNTFAFFFNRGHAAERFISKQEDFDHIINFSSEIPRQVRWRFRWLSRDWTVLFFEIF